MTGYTQFAPGAVILCQKTYILSKTIDTPQEMVRVW